MPSERVQRQIDRLLDQCEEAIAQRDWAAARELSESVLRMDPGNADALAYLAAAQPPEATGERPPSVRLGDEEAERLPLPLGEGGGEGSQPESPQLQVAPSSFCDG